MKSNIKYSTNELLKYIELYLDGLSFRELCDDYQLDLDATNFQLYVRKYLEHGVTGLLRQQNNRHYSDQFKYQVIQEYLRSNTSYKALAVKYNIPSHETVRQFIPSVFCISDMDSPLVFLKCLIQLISDIASILPTSTVLLIRHQ